MGPVIIFGLLSELPSFALLQQLVGAEEVVATLAALGRGI